MSQKTIEAPATIEQAKQLGLLEEEYDKIVEFLGRKPNFTELSVYSVMWSEHCSYKNSILWLKKLPKDSPRVLAAAGEENAGLMDIGDGLAVAFKIESHNHPSAIEPYQGAATGVGGIHRDIFTLGARPVAALDSLRFGDLELPKTRRLVQGVVRGIGTYGNSFGIPTVTGEVYFDPCYNTNPLVNAMSVGVVKHGETASATANGVGNPVFIVGAATGRDGIHGATFASGDIHEDSAKDLPSVQVGDPFAEKLLLEATLETIASGIVVGMQDMGAAGISCSTSEMSAKGQCGMDIWLDKVPMREAGMKPFELLLSESQERMLIVVKKGEEETITRIFQKWDLNVEQIGEVTEGGTLRYFMHGELAGEIPADSLVLGGGAPVYERKTKKPAYLKQAAAFEMSSIEEPQDLTEATEFLLQLPSIASRNWITEQYDTMVGTGNMSSNKPSDAAVVRIKDTEKALAMTVNCNSRYVMLDPEKGTGHALARAVLRIAASGGEALGVTNCLNFGNPYNPEVYWQFTKAVTGLQKACKALKLPVTGGNVSFYNQSSDDGPVYPTPTIGVVGLLESVESHTRNHFRRPGDLIYLLGTQPDDFGGSDYLYHFHEVQYSPAPELDLKAVAKLASLLTELTKNRLLASARTLGDGGLMIAMLGSGYQRNLGFELETDLDLRRDTFLFGEAGGRVVVSVKPELEEDFLQTVEETKVPMLLLGQVTKGKIEIDGEKWQSISYFKELYMDTLEDMIDY